MDDFEGFGGVDSDTQQAGSTALTGTANPDRQPRVSRWRRFLSRQKIGNGGNARAVVRAIRTRIHQQSKTGEKHG